MNKIYSLIVLTCLTLLTACNGASGKNETPSEQLVATSISLSLSSSNGNASFPKDEAVNVSATVLDQDNNPLSGQKVDFTATLGEVSPSSALTNASGVAQVVVNNANLALGAGSITAEVAVTGKTTPLSNTINFEFIESDTPTNNTPVISSEILLSGVSVNQFKTNETAQVSVKLVDGNNQVITGEIIDFSAEVGVLSAPSALTNEQGIATVDLTGNNAVGAGVFTATYRNENISTQLNYQILAADVIIVEPAIKIGSFDKNNTFNEGVIALSADSNVLSAGGTMGLTVDLIDSQGNRLQTPTPVSFTSNCVTSNEATIENTVFTVNGSAQATFEDSSCASTSGVEDVIVASITVNGITETASTTINIQGEQLGSIEFVSAEPNSIVLKGTGGQNKQETSLLTFRVKSNLGNVLAQQQVDFSLNTTVGGITITPESGLTNSQGLITTRVLAGTVPTAVRVTAKSTLTQNNESVSVQTQSDLLSINTGLPEQRSFTVAASVLNPEANSFNGEESIITAWLADNFNNPVPDGTTVNFTTEGGVIEPSCATVNGSCSVKWTSAEPRVSDHRVTILATALGHESFFDTNGNNSFDDNDGSAIVEQMVSAGFGRITPQSAGFIDMSEAWRDDNEDGVFQSGETFLDFNNNSSFDSQDSLFNGPQCNGALCATTKSTHVRKSIVLVMSGSSPDWSLVDSNNNATVFADVNGNGIGLPNLADGASQAVTFVFSDFSDQPLPSGTQIVATVSAGEIAGATSYTQGNTSLAGDASMPFVLINPAGGDATSATLTITVTTPNNIVTTIVRSFNLL